jgi:uncharacterized protein
MTMAHKARWPAVALALAVAACSTSPPATLYTLVPRPGQRVERALPPVTVRTVDVPKYLDRPQIVRYRNSVELATHDLERWGEGLDGMVTRVLVEDLSLRLPATQVTMAAGTLAAQAERSVAVDLARFDADPGGTAVIEARWTIRRSGGAEPVRLERIAVPTKGDDPAALVSALSDGLAQLADRIAGALAK